MCRSRPPERGCVIHPVPGLMYNLPGTQRGLSHGFPLCSDAVCPAVGSSSSNQLSPLPLYRAPSPLSRPLWMSPCQSVFSGLSRVTGLYPPPPPPPPHGFWNPLHPVFKPKAHHFYCPFLPTHHHPHCYTWLSYLFYFYYCCWKTATLHLPHPCCRR